MMCVELLPSQLLSWYKRNGRLLPWRVDIQNPYTVWVAEIMLQQTTVATTIPYYRRFLKRFPTLQDLGNGLLEEVLCLWQGLGYYKRAHHLHRCARILLQDFDGTFPSSNQQLLTLPGIGPYTAAALSSIVFHKPIPVVDGNVIRVLSRVYGIDQTKVYEKAKQLTPHNDPGTYAQAIMDLGATVCMPKQPKCIQCPWQDHCYAFQTGQLDKFPPQKIKKNMLKKSGTFFILIHPEHQAFWGRLRLETELLKGMMEIPSSSWQANQPDVHKNLLQQTPNPELQWTPLENSIQHTFTHFKLLMDFWVAYGFPRKTETVPHIKESEPSSGQWITLQEYAKHPWPTLMKKALNVVFDVLKSLG